MSTTDEKKNYSTSVINIIDVIDRRYNDVKKYNGQTRSVILLQDKNKYKVPLRMTYLVS